jgi:hypothetical protein
MAEVDDWAPVGTPAKAADDDWAPVGKTATGPDVAVTPGEKDFAEDKRLVEQAAGFVPGGLKAATYSGLNAFLLNAPSHVVSAYTALKEGKPYEEAFKEQKRYETALERQYPVSSGAGTAAGIGASLLVPMGAVGQAGRALQAGTAAKLAGTSAPQIVKSAAPAAAELLPGAGVAGAMTGVSSALERPVTDIDVGGALKDAAIGAGIGAGAQAAIPALTRYFSKFPDAVDAAGNLKPEAIDAVKKAFPNMEEATIKSFQDEIAKTFRTAGATPEAAKEALALKEGLTPTRTMVSGERPKAAAADIAEKAAIQGEQKLSAKASELAGEAPSSPYAAAEALHGAERGAYSEYKDLITSIGERPGTFKPETFDLFTPAVERALTANKLPSSFEGTPSLKQAAAAKKFLDEGIAAGNLPNENAPFNFSNVEMVRKELNNFWFNAKGNDRRAVGIIKDGFDNALDQAIKKDLFSKNGQQLIEDLKKSREMWTEYKNKFYDSASPEGAKFRKAVKSLADQQAQRITTDLPIESAKAAQGVINLSLLDKNTGLAMYERLNRAIGAGSDGMKAVNEQIRNSVLTSTEGLSKLPKSIDDFLSQNREIAGKVFSANEIADMRRLSESIKMISGSKLPNEQKESKIINAVQRLGSLVGAIAMWNVHGSPLAGAATYVAGEAGRAGLEAAKAGYQRGIERKAARPSVLEKAPEAARVLEGPITPVAPVRNIEPLLEQDEMPANYQAPTPLGGRPGRKAGGRVGSLSDKLVTAVDRAKKNINNDTKVLLNADDNHVAKALEVANRHLEG